MRIALWSVAFPLLIAVGTCPCAVLGAPMRCAVVETSALGGVVEVRTDDTPAPEGWPPGMWPLGKNKPYVSWRPPPSPKSPVLVVGYFGSTLANMGSEPSGGHIRFRISPPTSPDDTRVILSFPNGETLTLKDDDLHYGRDFGSDDEKRPVMDVDFSSKAAGWAKIKSSLIEGSRLGVKLVRHGETMADVTFDLSNRVARDALLALARRKVMEADRQVCTDAPLPVRRYF